MLAGKASPNMTFIEEGKPETGFVLEMKMTTWLIHDLPDGQQREISSETETTVTRLEEGELDPSLFEIPDGFHLVNSLEHQ